MPTSSSLGRPDVVSGIISVDSHDALALFDLDATFLYLVKKSLSLLELAPLEV